MENNENKPPPTPYQPPATPIGPQNQPSIGQDAGMRMLLPVGRSGWAIAAGYFGLFSFIGIGAPFAFITGLIAIFDIRKSRKTDTPKHGMGRAIFGLVSGLVVMILLILSIIWTQIMPTV